MPKRDLSRRVDSWFNESESINNIDNSIQIYDYTPTLNYTYVHKLARAWIDTIVYNDIRLTLR